MLRGEHAQSQRQGMADGGEPNAREMQRALTTTSNAATSQPSTNSTD